MVLGGLFFRTKTRFDSLLIYTGYLIVLTPAIANQYLSIPVPLVSVFPNPGFFIYTVISTVHLLIDSNGVHLPFLQSIIPAEAVSYNVQYLFFFAGFLWLATPGSFRNLVTWIKNEIIYRRKTWLF